MLITNFTNETSKSLRITQEFSQILIKVNNADADALADGSLMSATATIFLESSGKNIDIAHRISLLKLIKLSQTIENVPNAKRDNDTFFVISLFNGGNFKLSDSDALIIEFENITGGLKSSNISVYGIVDFETCEGLYKYEEKTLLQGEKEKLYNTQGVERIQLSGDILEVGFYLNDENGKLTERKFTKEELAFLEATQVDTNPFVNVDVVDIDHNQPITLTIDGVEEVKLYANTDANYNASIVMQSTTKIATTKPKAELQTYNPSVTTMDKFGMSRSQFLTTNK